MILPTPKILVVDDNPANLTAMRKLLARLPCEVVTAPSGNEALGACVREDFALVFLDLAMPDMDGHEVAELLKGDPATSQIPVVILTATPSDHVSRMKAYSVGAVDYIEKPLEEQVVLAKAGMFLDLFIARQQLRMELARSEELRKAERENEARYRGALDGAPVPVMVHAEDGEILVINRAWQDLTGYAVTDLPNLSAWTARAFGPQAGEVMGNIHKLYGIGGLTQGGEHVVRTAFGTNLIWDFRSTPLPPLPDGRRVIVTMAADVTGYRRAMREQSDAARLAQHADRAKGKFLANMSHEIRTPMNAIIGLTQLALETELSARQRDYLQKIKTSSAALLNIINDILDFSKIEAGRLELERIPFFLEEVLRDVSNLFLPVIEQKGLELFVEIAPGTPLSLVGDPLRLGQVLNNLVGNAVKFTETGEIHLRVEPVEADGQNARLRIAVRDTGIGLSKEQADRLFSPFIQADGSTTRRYGGTGLGLTISRHLVDLMDGQIAVSSAPGDGSTFAFTAQFGIGTERRNLAGRHHLAGVRALVVDDQETSLTILGGMIEAWSGHATTLSDSTHVVDHMTRAEADGNPFEIVFLDWQMPGLNGIDVARKIEEAAAAGRVKRPPMVIMVTAFSKDRLMEEAAELPLDGFLTKPVTPSALFNAVMDVRNPDRVQHAKPVRPHGTPYEIARPIRGAHVLVVEDNVINQEVAREFLEKAGLRVSLADGGRVGVDEVRRHRFDAILMDMQMPEMDGLEATRHIRRLPGAANLPIIAMTAAAMPEDKQACADAGMNDHVSKPIVPAELLATLVKWVKPREQAEAPAPPPQTEDFPAIAGIDRRQAALRLAGNRMLFVSLLGQMVEKFDNAAASLRQALAGGHREDAARLLHALRGVAGNVSAIEVATVASAAEAAIRDGRDGDVPGLIDRLGGAMDELFTAIRSHLGSVPAVAEGAAAPLDLDALDALTRALRAQDAVALELFEGLKAAIASAQGAEYSERLRSAIYNLRFGEAADLLAAMGG